MLRLDLLPPRAPIHKLTVRTHTDTHHTHVHRLPHTHTRTLFRSNPQLLPSVAAETLVSALFQTRTHTHTHTHTHTCACSNPQLPPGGADTLVYEVELLDVDPIPNYSIMKSEELSKAL